MNKKDTNFLTVLCTYPKPKASQENNLSSLIKKILEQKLAACINRVPGIISNFTWQGNLEEASEELWLIKTSKEMYPKLCEVIKEHHPYDCPEIIALPIALGNKEYLNWLEEQTTN